MEKIDGKKIAQEIIEKLKKLPKPEKMLAAVLVGSTGSPQAARSLSFLRQKEKMAADLGVAYHLYQYDYSIIEADLIKEIKKIGNDGEIGGIIVQLPLPRQCPNCRHLRRLSFRNAPRFYRRTCSCAGSRSDNGVYANQSEHFHGSPPAGGHCSNEFETSYAPDRPEIVYCEQCYQNEVS